MMKTNLQLKMVQNFQLTPQLQQSLKFLQLSSLELEETLHQLLSDNPFLTLDANTNAKTDKEQNSLDINAHMHQSPIQADDENRESARDNSEESTDLYDSFEHGLAHDLATDSQWEDYYPSDDSLNQFSMNLNSSANDLESDYIANQSSALSIQDYLLEQINLSPFTPNEKVIAYYIIDDLNEEGYLSHSKEELLTALKLEEQHHSKREMTFKDDFNSVLLRIQRFDPIGLATWTLQERLLIQLESLPSSKEKKDAELLLTKYSDALGKRKFADIAKSAKLEESEIKVALKFLSQLDPFPTHRFTRQKQSITIPDIIMTKRNGSINININNQALPQLKIDNEYVKMLQKTKKTLIDHENDSQNPLQYLQKAYDEAKNVLISIDNRHKTLLLIANQIIAYQLDFFESKQGELKAMTLTDIAKSVEMSESTVSRACQNKTLICDKGIFELKYFFQSHVKNEEGEEVSAHRIKSYIAQLIESENKAKPLSDSKLEKLLNDEGMLVARRTIAKYREQLGYASSSLRKML